MKHTHEWELIFNPYHGFGRVVCKHCPEQMRDAEIEYRINEYAALKRGPAGDWIPLIDHLNATAALKRENEGLRKLAAINAELLKVVELLVNDTADLDIVINMGREAIRNADLTSS